LQEREQGSCQREPDQPPDHDEDDAEPARTDAFVDGAPDE
jgi:hypothetical protein